MFGRSQQVCGDVCGWPPAAKLGVGMLRSVFLARPSGRNVVVSALTVFRTAGAQRDPARDLASSGGPCWAMERRAATKQTDAILGGVGEHRVQRIKVFSGDSVGRVFCKVYLHHLVNAGLPAAKEPEMKSNR